MAESVALLGWDEEPIRVVQNAVWLLDDRADSTNQVRVTTSLAEADGIDAEQELIFKERGFTISGVERDRAADEAVITADEHQAALADVVIVGFRPNSWTLTRAMNAVLDGTRWTLGEVSGTRYGRADFDEITALDALHFLARHQDAKLSFDSLRRRVNITQTYGTAHEYVFTYGRQLSNITKDAQQPTTTIIYPTMADDVALDPVEDYGYYMAQGLTRNEAHERFRKEEHWSDSRYEIEENMTRDAQKRLEEEAYPSITYTLTAQATVDVEGADDFDLSELRLGDTVFVWDQEIDTKLSAEVTAVTTSSDQSQNELTLSTLPASLGDSVESRGYFGDSGKPSSGGPRRSGPQPKPSMPILEQVSDYGTAVTRWNGQDSEGNFSTIPQRFGTLLTLVAPLDNGVIPSPNDSSQTFMGSDIVKRGGGTSNIGFNGYGEFAIWYQMRGWDGMTLSEFSEPLVVDVPPAWDPQPTIDKLDNLNDVRLPGLEQDLNTGLSQVNQNLVDLDGEMSDLDQALTTGLEDAQEWRKVGAINPSSVRIGDYDNLLPETFIWELNEGNSDAWAAYGKWVAWTGHGDYPIAIRYDGRNDPPTSIEYLRFGGAEVSGIRVKPGDEFTLAGTVDAPAGDVELTIRYGAEGSGKLPAFVHRQIVGEFSGWQEPFTFSWSVPDDDTIRRMQLEFRALPGMNGVFSVGNLLYRRRVGADLLVDGSVLTDKLASNSVATRHLQSYTIATRHLAVGNWDNLMPPEALREFALEGNASPFRSDGTWIATTHPAADGEYALQFTNDGSGVRRVQYVAPGGGIRVKPGDEFTMTFKAVDWSGGNVAFGARYSTGGSSDGSLPPFHSRQPYYTITGQGDQHTVTWRVPDDDTITHMQPEFNAGVDASGVCSIGNILLRRRVDAELLVDGVVRARHLDAEEIFFDTAVGNTVAAGVGEFLELNADQIRSNSWTGIVATGATFQTHEAANEGVKMTPAGLRGWDGGGDLSFRFDGSNNFLRGSLHAGLQAGSEVHIDYGLKTRTAQSEDGAGSWDIETPYIDFRGSFSYQFNRHPSIYIDEGTSYAGMMFINPGYPTGTDDYRGVLNVGGDIAVNRAYVRNSVQSWSGYQLDRSSNQPGGLTMDDSLRTRLEGRMPDTSGPHDMIVYGTSPSLTLGPNAAMRGSVSFFAPAETGVRRCVVSAHVANTILGYDQNRGATASSARASASSMSYTMQAARSNSGDVQAWVYFAAYWV